MAGLGHNLELGIPDRQAVRIRTVAAAVAKVADSVVLEVAVVACSLVVAGIW